MRKAFKYKRKSNPPTQNLNRLQGASNDELLSGYVKGQAASDLEERFARALDRAGRDYYFQAEFAVNIPGQDYSVDFVVDDIYPIEIDGAYAHKSGEAKAHDQIRDAILNEFLAQSGFVPIQRIPGDMLEDQADADRIVQETF